MRNKDDGPVLRLLGTKQSIKESPMMLRYELGREKKVKMKKRGRCKWSHGVGQKVRKKCLRAINLQLFQLLTESLSPWLPASSYDVTICFVLSVY